MKPPGSGQLDQATLHDLVRLFARVDEWADRTASGYPVPAPGSPLARDDQDTAPFQISHAVGAALTSAIDHMYALRSLILDAHLVPARATFTLLRAALENGAVAVWLLAPPSRNERVLRRLRFQWADVKDGEAARELTDMPAPRSVEERKTQLQDLARARRLTPEQVSQVAANSMAWKTIVAAAGEDSPSLNKDDLLLIWMVCSGIAHARPWGVLGLLERREISRTAENVLNVQITAPDSAVSMFTTVAALVIRDAWAMFDQRSAAPY